MTYTPIPKGTSDWDVPVNAAFVDQDGRITSNASDITTLQSQSTEVRSGGWLPSDYGLKAWSMDPSQGANSQVLTSGTLVMVGIKIRSTMTLSNAVLVVSTAGSTLTSGQNLVGLYDSSGARLAQSADQAANWTSTGVKSIPFTSSAVVNPGTYYVAILSNGTTPISIPRETSLASNVINLVLPVANARVASLAGQTSMPANITMALRSFDMNSYWVGVF